MAADNARTEPIHIPCPEDIHNGGGLLKVPGFGHPVDFDLDTDKCFRHGVNDFANERLVVREIAMLRLMDAITEKPRWHEKVFDEAIVEKWRAEATATPLISPLAWDWCIRELREKTVFLAEHGFIKTFETGSVCAKADGLIDTDLRDELLAGVKPLLDVKDSAKDWQPNSNEQVLNLVHPSLHPLVYGRTRLLQEGLVGLSDCIKFSGNGTIASKSSLKPPEKYYAYRHQRDGHARYSTSFQWLPAEVRFKGEGIDVAFTSYINNLHPNRHKGLYSTISKIVSKAIPMWNEVLVTGHDGRVPPRIRTWYVTRSYLKVLLGKWDPKIEPSQPPAWHAEVPDETWSEEEQKYVPDLVWLARVEEYLALPDHPEYDTSKDDEDDQALKDGTWKEDGAFDMWRALDWKFRRMRSILHPEPGEAYTYDDWKAGRSSRDHKGMGDCSTANLDHDYPKVNLEKEFRDRGLQVIVKLASVELTPEKPEYGGGDWHLEGMMNEHIVATAIYYYDVENISQSQLDFRMEATLDDFALQYEQDDHEPLAKVFGCPMREEPAVQILGSVQCKSDRLLAFPNTLQHRVQPFKLLDPTRAGHRRFLVLWLVDPNYRIASTANVPPQQQDWVAPASSDSLSDRGLAAESQEMGKERPRDSLMSLETAKALRLELMQERTKLMPSVEGGFDGYNLCEH